MKMSSINIKGKKRNTLFLLLLSLINIYSFSQNNVSYSDSKFIYQLIVDSTFDSDSKTSSCQIKKIIIIDKSLKEVIQILNVEENNLFCNHLKDSILYPEDENFDNNNDFRLLAGCGAGPDCSYYHWFYNPTSKQFVRYKYLDDIVNPEFDKIKKVIFSSWRSSLSERGSSTYRYIKGVPVLIKENIVKFEDGNTISIEKRLINGKMKIVSKEIEKRTDE